MKHPVLVIVAAGLFWLSAVLYRHFIRHVADKSHYTFITVRGAPGTHETIGGGNIWEISSFFFVAVAGAICLVLAFVDSGRR